MMFFFIIIIYKQMYIKNVQSFRSILCHVGGQR